MSDDDLEKRHPKPFKSPGGKDAWVPTLKRLIPAHKIYVEPYAGGASLFWAKEASETEVLCDLDPGIAATFKFLQKASDADFEWIRSQAWAWSEKTFNEVLASRPRSRRGRAYKFKYLNLFSVRGRWALDRSESRKTMTGKSFLSRLEKFRERLEGVTLVEGDAIECMKEFDSPETFFYIDPPWKRKAGGNAWKGFDAEEFETAVKSLEGMALVSYQGDLELGEQWTAKAMTVSQGGISGESTQTLFANYKFDDDAGIEESENMNETETIESAEDRFGYDVVLTVPFAKAADEQQVVTGIVLEPDEVDSQNDTIKSDVIEKAAYRFLSRFNNGTQLGLMHKMFGDIGVELVESYIAPIDFELGGQAVKKGSWVMAVRVLDPKLWRKIKAGDITGFSIGGVAAVAE